MNSKLFRKGLILVLLSGLAFLGACSPSAPTRNTVEGSYMAANPAALTTGILYEQPVDPNGKILHSAWRDPDGSDCDEYVWDNFTLPSGGTITEIADIKCARVSSLDEFVEQGCTGPFDLCLLIPNNVLGFKRRTFGSSALEESVHAVRTVKAARPSSVIAMDVFPEYAPVLLKAGADSYLDFVDFDGLKSAAARCLNLPLAA